MSWFTVLGDFNNFDQKFPRSKKGVATLSFPQGLECYNFFLSFFRPIRNDLCNKTAGRNFVPDQNYYSLTKCVYVIDSMTL